MSGSPLRLPVRSAVPQIAGPASHWRGLRIDNVDWTVRQDCTDELLDAHGLRWDEWKRTESFEVIKTGPHRTVYRLDLASGEFYLKHFRMADWQAWLRNSVRPSPAERELEAVLRIVALRLPTFEPIAIGIRRRFGVTGDTYLVSRAIPEAIPLDHYLLTEFASGVPAKRSALRQRLATELGQLAARLHSAGVEHVDLHAGNLLIRPDAGPSESLLSLIDLHAVRFRSSLSQARRDRNLAALHQFFAQRSTRADRHRFWRAYETELRRTTFFRMPGSVDRADRMAHCSRLEELLDRAAHAGWRRADRAWKRGNRHVRLLDAGTIRCRGLATLDVDWLSTLRDAPETPFEQYRIRWCKQSVRHRVAEVTLPARQSTGSQPERETEHGANSISESALQSTGSPPSPCLHAYWKCVAESGWCAMLPSRFRLSPVRRAWETGHALLRRGIDTPRPMLCVESTNALTHRGYLLTEAVENSTTVSEFFSRRWPTMNEAERADWLARHSRQLAWQLRRMHDAGFDHRDLKFPNLLVSNDDADDRTWLLDLDAVRAWSALPRHRATQNLCRLNVSCLLIAELRATDRLRFLKWYLGAAFTNEWKHWWRTIAHKSLRKIDRNQRASRP